ncbi:MAG: hypothetical protein HOB05_12755 [Bacteroidetes bacterium]|nr:hypothetical protein [Bacteroidota bacterium]
MSKSYAEVWELLNNTLYSVCNQQDENFRVIVVCDKQLPLSHHSELISKYTEFVEADFPDHGMDVIDNFHRYGNLPKNIKDPQWWNNGDLQDNLFKNNQAPNFTQDVDLLNGKGNWVISKLKIIISLIRKKRVEIRKTRKLNLKTNIFNMKFSSEKDLNFMANVVLNKGSKLLIGLLAAKKYHPEYVMFFDADDYIGNDISAYVNSHPGENGWIMAHGYKLLGNRIAPFYRKNSFCGTGNVYNFSILLEEFSQNADVKNTQNEIFEYVNSEFLISIGQHERTRSYQIKKGRPFKEYPTKSAMQLLGHVESNEFSRRSMRGKEAFVRIQKAQKYKKFAPIPTTLINYFNVLPKNTTKVFCLGFHKTGTTSIDFVLQDMGYQVSKYYKQQNKDFYLALQRGDFSEVKKKSELYNAFQDTPWYLFYKEFDQWYPGSKFILTTRDSQPWWASFLNYFSFQTNILFKYIYGFSKPTKNKKNIFIKRFENHNREVVDYFKDRPDDLLVVDVSDEESLKKVCAFLGKNSNYSIMPHTNSKLRRPTKKPLTKLKQIYKTLYIAFISIVKRIYGYIISKLFLTSSPPILIGGCPESGKKWLLSILSSDPKIHAISREIKLKQIRRHPLLPQRNKISKNNITNGSGPLNPLILKSILSSDPILNSKKRWCGVSSLSVLVYDQLLKYYGKKIKIINMVRDGRDVVTEKNRIVAGRFAVSSNQWVHDITAGRKLERHPQVLTIKYEDLVQNFEKTINELKKFIGEDDFSLLLKYPKNATIMEDRPWIGKYKQPQYIQKVESLLNVPGAIENLQHYGYLD